MTKRTQFEPENKGVATFDNGPANARHTFSNNSSYKYNPLLELYE